MIHVLLLFSACHTCQAFLIQEQYNCRITFDSGWPM